MSSGLRRILFGLLALRRALVPMRVAMRLALVPAIVFPAIPAIRTVIMPVCSPP
jgi:hypothetical protein